MEPVKPVSRTSKNAQTKAVENKQKQQNSEKVKIGGVLFNRNQIDESKTKTYTQDGKKMNTVFVKPGVQINYPDQSNKNNNPSIEKSVVFNENTEKFWNTYQNNGWYGVQQLLKEMRPNLLIRTKNIIINYVYRKLY